MKTRIIQLMAKKQLETGERITTAVLAEKTDLSRQTINSWVNGKLKRFDEESVRKLCVYFNCEVGDLLYLDREAVE